MIRRGFWLALGATLGVSGYRRASRLAHSLAPAGRRAEPDSRAVARRPTFTGGRALAVAARAGRSSAEGVAFARDVRDGMTEYLDRHVQDTGRTLGSQPGPARPWPGRARQDQQGR